MNGDKKNIQEFFSSADLDGDGLLTLEEAKVQGMDIATFHEIDREQTGEITLEMFLAWQKDEIAKNPGKFPFSNLQAAIGDESNDDDNFGNFNI